MCERTIAGVPVATGIRRGSSEPDTAGRRGRLARAHQKNGSTEGDADGAQSVPRRGEGEGTGTVGAREAGAGM